MTNRDRLTELFNKALLKWENLRNDYLEEKIDDIDNFNDVIIDYLLANGVILTPCKVGDAVYYITGIGHNIIKSAQIKEIIIDENGIKDLYVKGDGHNFENSFDIFFLTREEAEKALKERKQ